MTRFVLLVLLASGCDAVLGLHEIVDASFVVVDSALGTWRPAQPLTELNTPFIEHDASITGDGLVLLFSTNTTGNSDIYMTSRASADLPFPAATRVAELSTTSFDSGAVSADGLTYYATRDGLLTASTRADRGSPFGMPTEIVEITAPTGVRNPSVSGDGLQLVFNQDITERGQELYISVRGTTSERWQPPRRIDELSTARAEASGCLDELGRVLFFSSDRIAGNSVDLFLTTRTNAEVPFSFATTSPLVELNTTAIESEPHVTPDLSTIVFRRDDDLYISTR